MFEINTEQILILLVLFLLYKLSKCSVIEGLGKTEKMKWGGDNCPITARPGNGPLNWYKEEQCPAYYKCARKCMRGETPDQRCEYDNSGPYDRYWEYKDNDNVKYTYSISGNTKEDYHLGGICFRQPSGGKGTYVLTDEQVPITINGDFITWPN